MLNRRIDSTIEEHFASTRKALFLTGARQVGKTFAIRKYAQTHRLNLVEMNFLLQPETISVVRGAGDVKELLLRISAYASKPLETGRTLIFFDEVQEYADIMTWVKALVDEGSYRYALSGSLLRIEMRGVRSVPVGYMSEHQVYPLDFEEFALINGLLSCQYSPGGIQLKILKGEVNVNYGAVFENAVAQELHAHGWDLYYFNSKKQGEVDFLLETDSGVIPVEVKSGKDFERHNALNMLMSDPGYGISKAYVLCNDNTHTDGAVEYLPVYMAMFIKKGQNAGSLIYKVDLSGLQ